MKNMPDLKITDHRTYRNSDVRAEQRDKPIRESLVLGHIKKHASFVNAQKKAGNKEIK